MIPGRTGRRGAWSGARFAWLWMLVPLLASGQEAGPHHPPVEVHASAEFTRWTHSSQLYSLEHPVDWKVHESPTRTNIGPDDGLQATARGFRTIYGVIVSVVDDPEAAKSPPSLEASGRAFVETILARNRHLRAHTPIGPDRPFAGGAAVRAVLTGISPATGHPERAEVVCRTVGESRLLYMILACPEASCAKLVQPFTRIRESVRVTDPPPPQLFVRRHF
ncbi:MAG: hypothetical protein ACRD26_06505 [Vicinamibacterales bacterium]